MIRNIEARMAQAMSKGKCPPLVVPHSLADCAVLDTEQTEAWPRYLRLPVGDLPPAIRTSAKEQQSAQPRGSAMRKSRYTEEQIIGFIKQADAGMNVADLCRKEGFSTATFYKWRSKFGGMEASDAKRLRELEGENAKLKKLLAEAVLDNEALKVAFGVKR